MSYAHSLKLLASTPLIETLSDERRESLFKDYMKTLFTARVKDFRDLLDESRSFLTPHLRLDEVRDRLREDERYKAFPERNRQHTFAQHVEFLGKKVKREFMLFMNDMGTQMNIQKIKARHMGNIRETIREVCELMDETDDRFLQMSQAYPEERDLIVR
jgi:hypothetical protein